MHSILALSWCQAGHNQPSIQRMFGAQVWGVDLVEEHLLCR